MPAVDIVDSTWLRTSAAALGPIVGEPANWRRWWPSLSLRPTELRGAKGVRWSVQRVTAGPARGLAGSAEIWLQAADDGVVAHFFLRLDAPDGTAVRTRTVRRIEQYYRARTKRALWSLADEVLDPDRMTRDMSRAVAADPSPSRPAHGSRQSAQGRAR